MGKNEFLSMRCANDNSLKTRDLIRHYYYYMVVLNNSLFKQEIGGFMALFGAHSYII
jgi:hypothetical protein